MRDHTLEAITRTAGDFLAIAFIVLFFWAFAWALYRLAGQHKLKHCAQHDQSYQEPGTCPQCRAAKSSVSPTS